MIFYIKRLCEYFQPYIKDRMIIVNLRLDNNFLIDIQCYSRDRLNIIDYYAKKDYSLDLSKKHFYLNGVKKDRNIVIGSLMDEKQYEITINVC